ncbi:MAG TPA: hypothetical protein VGS58_22535 [Candidatus Sulfopaludibacter sp.]|nr:hypothetical protein [Candidatus Sulfopaludibacter sp.]
MAALNSRIYRLDVRIAKPDAESKVQVWTRLRLNGAVFGHLGGATLTQLLETVDAHQTHDSDGMLERCYQYHEHFTSRYAAPYEPVLNRSDDYHARQIAIIEMAAGVRLAEKRYAPMHSDGWEGRFLQLVYTLPPEAERQIVALAASRRLIGAA